MRWVTEGEGAHEEVEVCVLEGGPISDDLDLEALEHRQGAFTEEAVEVLAAARHELVRPKVEYRPVRPAGRLTRRPGQRVAA